MTQNQDRYTDIKKRLLVIALSLAVVTSITLNIIELLIM